MEQITLQAQPRPTDRKARVLLREQLIPAISYGHGFDNEPVVVAKRELMKVYERAGHSSLIDLAVTGQEPYKVLIHDIQYHPLTDQPVHVDLYRVKMTEKIKTEIPLKLVGVAPAVDDLQGTLIQNKDHLRVEALPQDLVHEIEVDVSALKTFEEKILVRDIKIPKGVTVHEDSEDVVALAQPPRSEEELAELEEKVEEKVEEVEVEEKGKDEEAAGAGEVEEKPKPEEPAQQLKQ